MFAGHWPHDEGLNDPVLPNGIDQLLQSFRGKFLARLQRTGSDIVQIKAMNLFARLEIWLGRRGAR